MNCVFFVVGLGPSDSNTGDISGQTNTPTFVETLAAQKQISQLIFGIYIAPLGANGAPKGSGEITFGGIDKSKIQGVWWAFESFHWYIDILIIKLGLDLVVDGVTWVPQNDPLNFHWEFNV